MSIRLIHQVLSIVAITCSVSVMLSSPLQHVRVNQVAFDGKGLFSWAKRGTLVAMVFESDRSVFRYVYLDSNNRLLVLTHNQQGCSAMISEQLDSRVQAEKLLREAMCNVGISFFGERDSYLVTEAYIENRRMMPSGNWDRPQPTKEAVEKSMVLLQRYAKPVEPLIEGNGWNLQFYTTSQDGRVEKWEMGGDVFPFLIRHLDKTIAEKPGTIVPMSPAP